MNVDDIRLVIGVDAGGTKTEAMLGAADAAFADGPLGTGKAGSGNLRAVGFDAATQQILSAIHAAFDHANLEPQTVHALCLSVAGAGRASEREQLQTWALQQNLANQVVITSDAEPLLAAASPSGVGIALISGTGSLAWGRNRAGATARTGGWGYLFGDEGSGYAIAVAGLRAVAQAADERAPATALTDRLLNFLNVTEPPELIARIYGDQLTRQQLAACAPVVFEAAAEDQTAAQITEHAADQLADMVTTLASRLGFIENDYPLAVTGGVLVHQPRFCDTVLSQLQRSVSSVTVVRQPAVGALAMARAVLH